MRPAWLRHRRTTALPEIPEQVRPCRRGSLVFAVPVGGCRVDLDCLLDDDDRGRGCRPVHLAATLAATGWTAQSELDLLERWSADGEPVGVEVTTHGPRQHVRLRRGAADLELTAAAERQL